MGNHIFVSSGDCCPQCEGLNGEAVSSGYKPHQNCRCSTRKATKKDANFCEKAGFPEFIYKNIGGIKTEIDIIVEVTCPGGGTNTGFSTITVQGSDDGIAMQWAEVSVLEDELCHDCGLDDPSDDLIV